MSGAIGRSASTPPALLVPGLSATEEQGGRAPQYTCFPVLLILVSKCQFKSTLRACPLFMWLK